MEILVNHLTRMSGSYVCVAGIDEDGRHIRPVVAFGRLEKGIVADFGGPFRLGAVVDLGTVTPRPDPPEVEDYVFDPAAARQWGTAGREEFWGLLEELAVDSLVGIFGETWLATVRPLRCRLERAEPRSGYIGPDPGSVSIGHTGS